MCHGRRVQEPDARVFFIFIDPRQGDRARMTRAHDDEIAGTAANLGDIDKELVNVLHSFLGKGLIVWGDAF
jgi:hypothetical protein